MQLLPVIDVQQGLAVHGVAGKRSTYAPLRSVLSPTSDPCDIAIALAQQFELTDVYLADLDGLARAAPNLELIAKLVASGISPWVDSGANSAERCRQLLNALSPGAGRAIVALETLRCPEQLRELTAACDCRRLVFSLDLYDGEIWTDQPAWRGQTPMDIVHDVQTSGIDRLIVLDVARVGTGSGPGTIELCRQLRAEFPSLELISGGGVRDELDLQQFECAGCDRVLIASALHRGTLTRDAIRQWLP